MVKTKPKYSQYTRGGRAAHILRRSIHLGSLLILWLYYQYGAVVAGELGITLNTLVWGCLGLVLAAEALRLWQGWTIFGQRNYEKKRLSAFAWSAIGMGMVLLFAPDSSLAIPIICTYALVDPLLGELRRIALPHWIIAISGIAAASGIWGLSHLWFGTLAWLALPMGVITVAAEWPCFSWIDDNALMQLVPLAVVILIT